ncbi:helix-turn-helix transcriptional regulator [Duganella dendranthematis]|jgi:DNA-binding transcriptional ArsR family regulator|uniref:Helix-turn-helix transcriptional regulator n=1 Tax=Duganella dendranthematis TaxID=2728021 RepID=A0ABX6MC85_9BURK|nr:metalloregulator ArsR/SmtB family transcription factor [Duganella dendranthematis]QJD91960.1 helix-turn-helix transcriptional regulator [Duganella dendranthematis]
MVKHNDQQLDLVFAALADGTRRRVLAQLEQGSHTISELAQQHAMSLPGFMKHLAVLEAAGLIARAKEGRIVRCSLETSTMQQAAQWITHYDRYWNAQLDALGRYLYHQEETCKQAPERSASSDTTPPAPTRSGAPGPTRKR